MKSSETSSAADNMAVLLGGGVGGEGKATHQSRETGAESTGVLAGAWEWTELNLHLDLCLM